MEIECLNNIKASDEERLLRQKEFSHLNDICYIDYTGAGVYSQSQMNLITTQWKSSVLSHPHGSSVISQLCVSEIDQIRLRILQYFDTDSDEYSVVFTSGATGAIKLVADYFVFNGGAFVYTRDNHTSVLGMREIVKTKLIHCLDHDDASRILDDSSKPVEPVSHSYDINSLFVYSAQCNFSGVKYPLSWCSHINKQNILQEHFQPSRSNWFVLLDAATFCASSKLSLKEHKPDFVSVSFYKMFGYPTGLGALIIKKSSASVLNKTYYGGGTVKIAMPSEHFHVKKDSLHDKFEDGTVNYLGIISLRHGFDSKGRISNGLENVSSKVFQFARYTYLYMKHLYYPNKQPAVELYADTNYTNCSMQGGIVNFNLLRENGTYFGYSEVQNLANLKKIQLRTGCHCNPGACQRLLHLSNETVKHHFQMGHVCGDDKDIIEGRPTGSVRISFGFASNWDDVKKFLNFITHFFLRNTSIIIKEKLDDFKPKLMENYNVKNTANDDVISNFKNVDCKENNCHDKSSYVDLNLKSMIQSTTPLELKYIFIYPVKSCGFFSVERNWEIDSSGLKYDRQWMVINQSGVALTQKHETKLCLIQPKINFDLNVLCLYFKDCVDNVQVPLDMATSDNIETSLDLCKSKVCNDKISGYDCGDEVGLWLDSKLGHSGLRLIRLKQRNSKHNLKSFSNMGQYLLISLPSVRSAIKTLQASFDACFNELSFLHRFRGNFIIDGPIKAFVEFDWEKIHLETNDGLLPFVFSKPCARCQFIYVDQETSEVTDVPLGITKFGIYINNDFHTQKSLMISVGNRVYAGTK